MKNIAIAKVILIITFFVSSVYSYSQTISFNELNDYVQDVRIGLVDEFFDRFNGKTTNPDIPKTKPDSRMKNLMMLFDLSQFSSKNDPRFVEAEALMKIVKEDSICINYADSTWAALAHCKGTLNGKSVKFDIFLTVQHRKANMYKWVISYVDGNLFDITPRNINDRIMLLPDDHETNFLSLKRMTSEQPFNINQFMVNGFNYEKTSAFVYLVYSKLLKIDYVDDLEFIFTQVPGYIFHVKYFERERNNAGWLISNFYESTNENKESFIHLLKPISAIVKNVESSVKEESIENDSQTDTIAFQKPEELEKQYGRRLKEKLSMVKDYVSFMQRDDSLRSQSVYKSKFENLFVNDVNVILHKGKKTESISLEEFCKRVINKKIKNINFDSIQVPIWDNKWAFLDSEIYKLEAQSSSWSFITNGFVDNTIKSDQKLFVYKEDTEDGIEWLPLFGDLSLSVK